VGKTFAIENDHGFWVGEFSGTVFNDAGQGFRHGTSWVCPEVNAMLNGISTASHGYCVVTDKDGDKACLVWQGGKGFEGDDQWTGGTGQYTGLTGNKTWRAFALPSTAQGYGLLKGEWQLP